MVGLENRSGFRRGRSKCKRIVPIPPNYVFTHECATVAELEKGLEHYFTFYNYERPHQSLSYQVPAEVHLGGFDSLLLNNKVSSILAGLWS